MSWFDDLFSGASDVVSGIGNFFGSNKVVGSLLSTVITGFALSKISKSIAGDTAASTAAAATPPPTDLGVSIQMPPAQDNKIPVFYGKATVSGIITEAVMTENRTKMHYVITIAERTGNTNLGSGAASAYTFNKIYLDSKWLTFDTDGVTVLSATDPDGNVDVNMAKLIKVWCFAGGSHFGDQVAPDGYTISPVTAYSIVPNWSSTFSMDELVFVVVEVIYNKAQNVTGLPNMEFTITNSMNQPGDCIYDMMTNTRYGAAIDPADITL